jgi:nicotinic acid mononucleotide adenylyltransferase
MRVGCYPGTFDPLTIAHLAIAQAAAEQCGLDRIDFVLSQIALGKEDRADHLDARVAAANAALNSSDTGPSRHVITTQHQLLADIAAGYDVLILGGDKWEQIQQLHWYGDSAEERDATMARLPKIAVAPRSPHPTPLHRPPNLVVLTLPDGLDWSAISSTAVRAGAHHWMATRTRPTQASSFQDTTPPNHDSAKPRQQ